MKHFSFTPQRRDCSIFLVLITMAKCALLNDDTITLTTGESFFRVVGYEGSLHLNISLQMKTWQEEGVLMFHKFSSRGHLRIDLFDGKTKGEVLDGDGIVSLVESEKVVRDGKWHHLKLHILQDLMTLTVDSITSKVQLPSNIRTGEEKNVRLL